MPIVQKGCNHNILCKPSREEVVLVQWQLEKTTEVVIKIWDEAGPDSKKRSEPFAKHWLMWDRQNLPLPSKIVSSLRLALLLRQNTFRRILAQNSTFVSLCRKTQHLARHHVETHFLLNFAQNLIYSNNYSVEKNNVSTLHCKRFMSFCCV